MIWASNNFLGLGLYFRVRAGFGFELVGRYITLSRSPLLAEEKNAEQQGTKRSFDGSYSLIVYIFALLISLINTLIPTRKNLKKDRYKIKLT